MKKKLLICLSFVSILAANAQHNIPSQSALFEKSENYLKKKVDATIAPKAQGDTLWSNDFSNPADWIAATGLGHTAGSWQVVNAMPISLTSQVPPRTFPTAMLSTSGGNFALIDSDAQGANGVQNATITTVNNIDLSAYGTMALYLRFKEIFRHFQERNFVDVSNDGGVTWTSFPVNTVAEVPVNTDSGNPDTETVLITAAIGSGVWSNNVKIRFRYEGAWDWFWGVDDVQIIEAFTNDLKATSFSMATDTVSTVGLDYHFIPVSQASFPGLTFQAKVINNGAATQNNAALRATSGAYNQTGPVRTILSGANDSLIVNTPFMVPTAIGNYDINLTTTLGVVDADTSNNQEMMTVRRDENIYARDNGILSGSLSNVSSQPDQPLKIGNIMEIFDPITVTSVSIRLVNQAAAVGQQIYAEIHKFNGATGEWEYSINTPDYTIQQADLSTFVKLYLPVGMPYAAGDAIWVMAGHYGSTDEVAFGMAQDTWAGTVRGITNDASPFTLTDPSAIMIRISDKDELGISEIENTLAMSIFPNPANETAKVRFTATTATNAVVSITDMAGKEIRVNTLNNVVGVQTVEFNTAELNAGVYIVNVLTDGAKSTRKLTIK